MLHGRGRYHSTEINVTFGKRALKITDSTLPSSPASPSDRIYRGRSQTSALKPSIKKMLAKFIARAVHIRAIFSFNQFIEGITKPFHRPCFLICEHVELNFLCCGRNCINLRCPAYHFFCPSSCKKMYGRSVFIFYSVSEY